MEFGPVTTPAPPRDARRRRRRIALAVLLVGAVAVGLRVRAHRDGGAGDDAPPSGPVARPARLVPDSVRIKVEVVNATTTRGLGRLATAWLRDQGFDVVHTTTAGAADRRDSSLVLDRSGHADWAALAAKAVGGARVEARPDSLRFLDLTVLVGRDWRPPPQTLYP